MEYTLEVSFWYEIKLLDHYFHPPQPASLFPEATRGIFNKASKSTATQLTSDFDNVEYDKEILPACLLWLGVQILHNFLSGSYLLFFQYEAN